MRLALSPFPLAEGPGVSRRLLRKRSTRYEGRSQSLGKKQEKHSADHDRHDDDKDGEGPAPLLALRARIEVDLAERADHLNGRLQNKARNFARITHQTSLEDRANLSRRF